MRPLHLHDLEKLQKMRVATGLGEMGGAKAHYDGIVAFSQTDFTGDSKINVPLPVMRGGDDQVVRYADSAPLAVEEASDERHPESLQGFSNGPQAMEAARP
jgi:hypothetical protein